MKVTTSFKPVLIALTFLLFTNIINAQPGGPGNPGTDPDPVRNGASVPIDLGLGIFIAAGIGYAAKKRSDKKSNTPPQNTFNN